jgi:hypothetical protein
MALMMKAARTSETLVNFYQTTRRYNPEDSNLQAYVSFVFMAVTFPRPFEGNPRQQIQQNQDINYH